MLRAGFVIVLVVVSGCRKSADGCEDAIARLARLDARKGVAMSQNAREQMIEACRTIKTSSYDPVLRCVMDSSTDDAAAACIDRSLEVVTPSDDAGPGSGLNPLLK